VNNVGVNVRKPIGQVTGADYSRMMATNVDSAFFLSQVTTQEATHTCGTGRQRCVGDRRKRKAPPFAMQFVSY
jgi:NAD(P)-dependent dehydrogenase (short-subunit alcohol dehydrogenase family)